MERTIRVTGKGRLAVRPDTLRITLTMEGVKKEYPAAMKAATEATNALREVLAPIGFVREDLKTLSLRVQAENESYQDPRDKHWKQRFLGYRYTHRMKLEFPLDNARLGRVLYALTTQKDRPELSLDYVMADPEAVRSELLANAVRDSRRKAEVLTEAAGVRLGELVTIDYSWGEVELVCHPMAMEELAMPSMAKCEESESYDMDIETDDIRVEDTVTVVWRIC